MISLLANLNARTQTLKDKDSDSSTPQTRTIRFAAWQHGNYHEGDASFGISTLLRSLGTMSFRRAAYNSDANEPDAQSQTSEASISAADTSIHTVSLRSAKVEVSHFRFLLQSFQTVDIVLLRFSLKFR